MSTIGERLRELRGQSSQAEMAASVGVKQQNWARWEGDVVTPSLDMIVKIIRAHPCPADWLLGIDRGTPPTPVQSHCTPGSAPICKQCKYLKAIKKLQKAGLQLPDDM